MDHHTSRRDYRHRDGHSKSRSRSRSRSPDRSNKREQGHHHRHSHSHSNKHSRSDDRSHRHHRHHRSSHHNKDRHHARRERRPDHAATTTAAPPATTMPITLPFQSRELSKRDLPIFEPILAMYLDIQKGKWIEDMGEEEVKGRWKSFVRKWNRGELAEGWYDPSTLKRARESAQEHPLSASSAIGKRRKSPDYEGAGGQAAGEHDMDDDDDDDDDEEDYGPSFPHTGLQMNKYGGPSSGPTIPTMQDLELRKETAIEDTIEARLDSRKARRAELSTHKSEIRQIQDEIAPRAEPGTHEHRMQKRQETVAANRAFAEARRGGSPGEAAPEEDLMGSGENDLAEMKKTQEQEKRKKNDREIRREEILRARTAEREEKARKYREKEEDTIGWLKELAKQRFG